MKATGSIQVKPVWVIVLAATMLNTTGCCDATYAASNGRTSDSLVVRQKEDVIGTIADGYIAIVNSTFLSAQAAEWNPSSLSRAVEVYQDAVMNSDHGYVSHRKGFGSLSRWAQAMGITPAPEECRTGCQFAGGSIRLMHNPNLAGDSATWYETTLGRFPAVTVGGADGHMTDLDPAYHELAHIWDGAHYWTLGTELDQAMEIKREANGEVIFDKLFRATLGRHGFFASNYFDPADPRQPQGCEHFAETVLAYFLTDVPDYSRRFHVCWADEDPRCDTKFEYDRYDFVRDLVAHTDTDRQ